MKKRKFFAIIEKDSETNLYVGYIPQIPGVHTQGKTLDELHNNLKEVLELCLVEIDQEEYEFVGIQEISI
ncbi:type II toxin-antitoxin system HicB family antitoxin [bacterium]|nr:type II toxin-antitoxin system HicB family antitoxin [bacterium]